MAVENLPPGPEVDPGDSVSARFEATAAAHPARPALHSRGQIWRYDDLNQAANRVAHALLGLAGPSDAPVALAFGHHAPAVTAILGVLKAGRCYAFLDPSFPAERNAAILADSRADLILCDCASLAAAATLAGRHCRLLVYEDLHGGLASDNPGVAVRADTALGLFYTSGSTGTPKGVLWRHDICLHRMAVDRLFTPVSTTDRLTLLTPLVFPAATSDLFWALLNGSCLCLYDIRVLGTAGLAGWLHDTGITCLRAPVALFRHLLDLLDTDAALPDLRRVVLSGDTLAAHDVARVRRQLPGCAEVVHRYSMSEAGLVCINVIPRTAGLDDGVVPIGRPVPGKVVRLLGRDGLPLPAGSGESGEIAVSSRHLAAGYRNLADDRFVADPESPGHRLYRSGDLGRWRPDGRLEFLGRADQRVKIRGYRVELAAIEVALLGLREIAAAAVLARPDASGEKAPVAYIVPRENRALDVAGLRQTLSRSLPEYMIPAVFIVLEAMPLTPGGKIDRRALATLSAAPCPRSAAPDGATETRLAEIWRAVLQTGAIGREDDFFSLGGHSLLAARLVAMINVEFGLALPLTAIYQAPTIAGLAALLAGGSGLPQRRKGPRVDPTLLTDVC